MSGNPNIVRHKAAPPVARATDRRSARRDATRREILDAAWTVARRDGLAALSLRDLGAAVGMTAQSLYTYFPSKSAIHDAMFREGYEAFAEAMETAVDGVDEPRHLAMTAAYTFIDFCTDDPARFHLLFQRTIPGFTPSELSWSVALDAYDRTAGALVRAGLVDEAGLDLWTALVTGLASQQVANDPNGTRWRDLVPRAVDALIVDSRTRGGQP